MGNRSNRLCAFVAGLLAISSLSSSAGEKFSLSGTVRQNIGCLEIVAAPVKNALVTIDENQSCIIDDMAHERIIPDFLYSTTTDSLGRYRFDNLDADSFICGMVTQTVTIKAAGYFRQSRDYIPKQDSLLNFDLLSIGSDSVRTVTVTVVKLDTAWSCMDGGGCTPHPEIVPQPNCRIELPSRYLFWLNPENMDTTDSEGKAVFPLSVIPFVDYRIVAQSLHDTALHGEVTANITACMGENSTITISTGTTPVKRTHSPLTRASSRFTLSWNRAKNCIEFSGNRLENENRATIHIYNCAGKMLFTRKNLIVRKGSVLQPLSEKVLFSHQAIIVAVTVSGSTFTKRIVGL